MIKKLTIAVIAGMICAACQPVQAAEFEKDVFQTGLGTLEITFIKHGTLMMNLGGYIIHIDPVCQYADYSKLPNADLVLITHSHYDHLDPAALKIIGKNSTKYIYSNDCQEKMKKGLFMKNGDTTEVHGIGVTAVPAYNIKHKRSNGVPFHPEGKGNGYILDFMQFRVFVAGDSENIPEYKKLKNIDVAFLPMNLPYTMTPEMTADAARMFQPKILYPYHYGETDTSKLVELMKNDKDIEVRIRQLQ